MFTNIIFQLNSRDTFLIQFLQPKNVLADRSRTVYGPCRVGGIRPGVHAGLGERRSGFVFAVRPVRRASCPLRLFDEEARRTGLTTKGTLTRP